MKKKTKMAASPKLKVAPSRAAPSRAGGQSMGNRFARLNGASMQRAENICHAISKGFQEAQQRDEITSALSQDNDFLERMGFGRPGRG